MMGQRKRLWTSEYVSMGHPDKVADQISDGILDAVLAEDPEGRVACEVLVATGLVVVAGEITTRARVEYAEVARRTLRDIGYNDPTMGFDADNCSVLVCVNKQSPDISQGVTASTNSDGEQGAGDQGLMMGYACTDTPELMPLPIMLARHLIEAVTRARQTGRLPWLRPDGKSQVTIEYDGDRAVRIATVVLSNQHREDVTNDKLRSELIALAKQTLPAGLLDDRTQYLVNPTGRFVIGGPKGDCGLTGRKIIVDTYGGWASHGGGAFSGKDPSKVDRSAAYCARWMAKNVVAAGLAERCTIQLAYVIGRADPTNLYVDTQGTGKVADERIEELLRRHFPLKPAAIIETLKLKRPVYQETARYGHFGRTGPGYTWESTDLAAKLKRDASGEPARGASGPAASRTEKTDKKSKVGAGRAPGRAR
jgi:S-adenosylmethionine synthetase